MSKLELCATILIIVLFSLLTTWLLAKAGEPQSKWIICEVMRFECKQ